MGMEGQRRLANNNDNSQNHQKKKTLIFTYGTLKRGFSNHTLMQDLISSGDAVYIGSYHTIERFPLVCGPYRVPFLLNFPGLGEKVWGEVYAVSEKGLSTVDELEGLSRGHYERHPIKVSVDMDGVDGGGQQLQVAEAEAYFAHRSYAEEMWRRNGMKGYTIYSEKEARGYVRRKDRPQHLTFLDHIRNFLSSPPPPASPSY